MVVPLLYVPVEWCRWNRLAHRWGLSTCVAVCGVISAGWLPLYIVPVLLAGAYVPAPQQRDRHYCWNTQSDDTPSGTKSFSWGGFVFETRGWGARNTKMAALLFFFGKYLVDVFCRVDADPNRRSAFLRSPRCRERASPGIRPGGLCYLITRVLLYYLVSRLLLCYLITRVLLCYLITRVLLFYLITRVGIVCYHPCLVVGSCNPCVLVTRVLYYLTTRLLLCYLITCVLLCYVITRVLLYYLISRVLLYTWYLFPSYEVYGVFQPWRVSSLFFFVLFDSVIYIFPWGILPLRFPKPSLVTTCSLRWTWYWCEKNNLCVIIVRSFVRSWAMFFSSSVQIIDLPIPRTSSNSRVLSQPPSWDSPHRGNKTLGIMIMRLVSVDCSLSWRGRNAF